MTNEKIIKPPTRLFLLVQAGNINMVMQTERMRLQVAGAEDTAHDARRYAMAGYVDEIQRTGALMVEPPAPEPGSEPSSPIYVQWGPGMTLRVLLEQEFAAERREMQVAAARAGGRPPQGIVS